VVFADVRPFAKPGTYSAKIVYTRLVNLPTATRAAATTAPPDLTSPALIPPAVSRLIVCPRDKQPLDTFRGKLRCSRGHEYGAFEGIPILLVSDAEQTHIEGARSLYVGETGDASQLRHFDVAPDEVDPFVQNAISATNGNLYADLRGKLNTYPIPDLRLPPGQGSLFLEVGCNWGRWCIAAARQGYRPVGIDPSLKALRAGQRVSHQLGVEAHFIVADGRFLPFPDASFERAFSYSVLQHLAPSDVRETLQEIKRVLSPGGRSLVQMANCFGVRSLYHQARRTFRRARDFEVRYWTPRSLKHTFETVIGPSSLSVDGFFSLNPQISDVELLNFRNRTVVYASEALRRLSNSVGSIKYVADSLYISSSRDA
jgi:SAM-dependent methyltransferase/uncharacterized protein YbaR (Trm112 family)